MKTLQGLITSVQSFGGELPFFFISGWFIRKVGYVNSMTIVLFTFGARLVLYSVLTNPWWALPIEITQGITSGIFYAAMASYANIVAPSGTAATLQVNSVLFHLNEWTQLTLFQMTIAKCLIVLNISGISWCNL